jgi:hypothetical protein
MYSIGEIVGKENMGRRVARGIGWTGAGGIGAGALGSIGTVSFGISPGVVLITRVGSRFPLTLCGIFLCLLAFSEGSHVPHLDSPFGGGSSSPHGHGFPGGPDCTHPQGTLFEGGTIW